MMFWPFKKRETQRTTALSDFDRLIIQADKTMSDDDRKNLSAAIDRKGYSEDRYCHYRTKLYTRLAAAGDSFAQYQLGDLAHTLKKTDEALHWYTVSANGGCTEAMYCLGLYYSEGGNDAYSSGGFGYDPVKSFENFLKAAEGGHLNAMHSVALCYEDGEGTVKDLDKAVAWAQRGADLGSWHCCRYLAQNVYNNLLHPMCDQIQALKWYRKSAEYADQDQFESTVRSMGYIYGGSYIHGTPETPLSNRKKAAYCFTMAYITSHDDGDKDLLMKTGYHISEQEFNALRNDTINRTISF